MTSAEEKTKAVSDDCDLSIKALTLRFTQRKKAGLIVANSAEIPQWMSDMELPPDLIEQRAKPAIFQNNPMKGTFADGFAMFNTYNAVSNFNTKYICNVDGYQFANNLKQLFEKSADGVEDFFIYYSGVGKSFNGDWMGYDIENDTIHVITLKSIVSKWNKRPNKTKDQYLLIIADTNYSGIWVSKATDSRYFAKYNILVQSSVGRQETAQELTIGEVKDCWISQITCGKFSHSWLQISNDFITTEIFAQQPIIAMKGCFVLLNKEKVWDTNEDYYDLNNNPMSNFRGKYDEKCIVCMPCYGNESERHHKHHQRNDDGNNHNATLISTDLSDLNINEFLEEIDQDFEADADENENENENENDENDDDEDANAASASASKPGVNVKKSRRKIKFSANELAQYQTLKKPRRLSHLPQPSVRRLNVLQGVKLGITLKHTKKRSRHVSTYTRGFIFHQVLSDIRQMIVGSDEDDDDIANDPATDWND